MSTMDAGDLSWTSERRLLDTLVQRISAGRLSVDEETALRETCWAQGQDVRLREDARFRPTPWERWILSSTFLANDAVYEELLRERRPVLDLESTLGALDKVVRRRCMLCSGDPRLVLDDSHVRLAARELTSLPLVEEEVTELERYVTHLPLHTLRAAAASEPAGQWGRRAQEQVIETTGWVRVALPGRKLTPRMFVARIEGHSMDDGKSGLVDGGYAVFDLWPAGSRQNLNVLVRGAFTDPETGSYAVKKYVADSRGEDGRHRRIALVSLNADKARYPDIQLAAPEEDDVTVVAGVVHALAPDEIARRPKTPRRRGRRDISSPMAQEEMSKRLAEDRERFFEATSPLAPEDGRVETAEWRTEIVCLDAASGGLHFELGPLRGLWSCVKRLRVEGQGWDGALLGSNVRERASRLRVPPSSGPWRWLAAGFEGDPDVDLSPLDVGALAMDQAHVFRVDALDIGRLVAARGLSPGQTYRILIPPALLAGALRERQLQPAGDGWALWEIDVPRPAPGDVTELAREIGLEVGEPAPSAHWVVTPPAEWRTNARGDAYACFEATPGPVAELQALQVEIDDEAAVFLHGPEGMASQRLPASESHLIHLGELKPGRYLLMAVHHRTVIPTLKMPFEVVDGPRPPPRAAARLSLGEEAFPARPGEMVASGARDLDAPSAAGALEGLVVEAPPGWPVRILWRELVERRVGGPGVLEDGCLHRETQRAILERARRAPVGDMVFDFAELGRISIAHERQREAAGVREEIGRLVNLHASNMRRGAYASLVTTWFQPVCAALGFEAEPIVYETLPEAPGHLSALRLLHVERQGAQIQRRVARVLILCEDVTDEAAHRALPWVDAVCSLQGAREALISDGLRWAIHKRKSRLPLRPWDLSTIVHDEEAFLEFLRFASEGV